jgi:poly(3-hydroxybutyrate) depolymerase
MAVNGGGGTREFILGLPANYDSSEAYPVVFVWHPAGGTDVQVAWGGTSSSDLYGGYDGLRYLSVQNGRPMIFIAGQGLNPNDAGTGWPNTNGEDVAFAQAMVSWLESNYCVDQSRIFAVGFSYGAVMSNTVGCAMGNVFRAIAPMDGIGPGFGYGSPQCVGQVGAWVAHGAVDTTIPIDSGMATRDYWAKANHCSTTSVATTPSPCVAYQGCDPGYPVDWCEFDGGHMMETFEPPGVWAFLQQF